MLTGKGRPRSFAVGAVSFERKIPSSSRTSGVASSIDPADREGPRPGGNHPKKEDPGSADNSAAKLKPPAAEGARPGNCIRDRHVAADAGVIGLYGGPCGRGLRGAGV